MNKLLIFLIFICAPCYAGIAPYERDYKPVPVKQEAFKTKSKYKTKARYFRMIEDRMLREIRQYFIRQSWRELEDPELRRRTFSDIPELNH